MRIEGRGRFDDAHRPDRHGNALRAGDHTPARRGAGRSAPRGGPGRRCRNSQARRNRSLPDNSDRRSSAPLRRDRLRNSDRNRRRRNRRPRRPNSLRRKRRRRIHIAAAGCRSRSRHSGRPAPDPLSSAPGSGARQPGAPLRATPGPGRDPTCAMNHRARLRPAGAAPAGSEELRSTGRRASSRPRKASTACCFRLIRMLFRLLAPFRASARPDAGETPEFETPQGRLGEKGQGAGRAKALDLSGPCDERAIEGERAAGAASAYRRRLVTGPPSIPSSRLRIDRSISYGREA